MVVTASSGGEAALSRARSRPEAIIADESTAYTSVAGVHARGVLDMSLLRNTKRRRRHTSVGSAALT